MQKAPATPAYLAALMVPILLSACVAATQLPSEAQSQVPSTSSPIATATPPPVAPRISWSERPFDGRVDGISRMAWTSNDGLSWEMHPVPARPTPDECLVYPDDPFCASLRSTWMGNLVRLDDTLYSFTSLRAGGDGSVIVGWRWTDGRQWEVIESKSEFFTYGGSMKHIAASDTALLAVQAGGLVSPIDRTWVWTPGTSWIRGGLGWTDDEEQVEVFAVSWSPRLDLFLAVGLAYTPLADTDPEDWPAAWTVWSSPDGRAWSKVAVPAGLTSACALDAIDAGIVMGGVGEGTPTIWTSRDGASWAAAVLPDAPAAASVCRVIELEDGLLAVGSDPTNALTWTSTDGSEWERGATLNLGTMAAAAIGNTVVLFGSRGDPPDASSGSILLIGMVEP